MNARYALIILTTINFLNYVDRWLVSAVMPAMKTDLGLSNTQAGFIMSAFMLGYFVTSPLFGYLADRTRRLNLVGTGTVLWSIATFVSGWGKSAAQIFAARIAVGIGEASTVSPGQSLIADYFPPERRNQAMAYFTAAIPIGSALGFIVGGNIEHHWGWRAAFFIAGIPGALVALCLIPLKEPKRGEHDAVNGTRSEVTDDSVIPKAQNFRADIATLLKNKRYMLAVLGYTAYTFTLGGFASWASQYLVAVRGVPLHEADNWFGALTVLTGILGSIAGGYGAAYFQKRYKDGGALFLVWTTAIAAPFAFLTFLLPDRAGFFTAIGITEFFLFLGQPAINVIVMEAVGPFLRGIATAFCVFVIHLLGDFISPPMVGWLADKYSLQWGIFVLPAALIPSAIFYWRCRGTGMPGEVSPVPNR